MFALQPLYFISTFICLIMFQSSFSPKAITLIFSFNGNTINLSKVYEIP